MPQSLPDHLSARPSRFSVAALGIATLGLAGAAIFWQPAPVSAQAAAPAVAPAAQEPAASTAEFYTQKVQPIFSANCYRCHANGNYRGDLKMSTAAGLMHGGKDGTVIVPGHPEQSLLLKLIRHEGPADDPMPMPPRKKLSDAEIATVTEWIKAGAIMPPDPPE